MVTGVFAVVVLSDSVGAVGAVDCRSCRSCRSAVGVLSDFAVVLSYRGSSMRSHHPPGRPPGGPRGRGSGPRTRSDSDMVAPGRDPRPCTLYSTAQHPGLPPVLSAVELRAPTLRGEDSPPAATGSAQRSACRTPYPILASTSVRLDAQRDTDVMRLPALDLCNMNNLHTA